MGAARVEPAAAGRDRCGCRVGGGGRGPEAAYLEFGVEVEAYGVGKDHEGNQEGFDVPSFWRLRTRPSADRQAQPRG